MKLAVELAILTSNSSRVAENDVRLDALQKEFLKKADVKQGVEVKSGLEPEEQMYNNTITQKFLRGASFFVYVVEKFTGACYNCKVIGMSGKKGGLL